MDTTIALPSSAAACLRDGLQILSHQARRFSLPTSFFDVSRPFRLQLFLFGDRLILSSAASTSAFELGLHIFIQFNARQAAIRSRSAPSRRPPRQRLMS
jgi:hypothetical protein